MQMSTINTLSMKNDYPKGRRIQPSQKSNRSGTRDGRLSAMSNA